MAPEVNKTHYSPINQKYIAQSITDKISNKNTTPPKPNLIQQDSFSLSNFSNKNSKKIKIAALLIATSTIAMALCKSGASNMGKKVNKILSESESIKKKGAEIQETINETIPKKIKEHYKQVTKLIEDGKNNNYCDISDKNTNTIIRFIDENTSFNTKIIEEVNGDKIVRRTEFNPDTLDIKNILINYQKNKTGIIEQAQERYVISNDIIKSYQEGYKLADDGSIEVDKFIDYIEDDFYISVNNIKIAANGAKKGEEQYIYSNGELCEYKKSYEIDENETEISSGVFCFENSKLSNYVKESKIEKNGTKEISETFEFSNNKPTKYFQDFKSKNGEITIKKECTFDKNGKIKNCEKNVTHTKK